MSFFNQGIGINPIIYDGQYIISFILFSGYQKEKINGVGDEEGIYVV